MLKIDISKLKQDKSLLKSKGKYFVGDAWLNDISDKLQIVNQKAYLANFNDGARTKVHYHQGGQILMVTKGKGMLVIYKKTSLKNDTASLKQNSQVSLKEGDIAFIPKNILHWHGALKGKSFAHIALNIFLRNGKEAKTIWYDSDFSSYAKKIK